MKKFAVIGLGNFGSTVVRELAEMKCKVTAIDIDKAKVQALQDITEVALLADASDRKFLENLDVGDFDWFIVSTGEDSHASILITLYLKELGASNIIVKANSEDHSRILLKVGATEAVIPEKQMAAKISRSLAQPNLIDFLPLSGNYDLAELVPPSKFTGKSLMKLKLRSKYNIQVVAVKDTITGEFDFAPGGDYIIDDKDILIILGKAEDIEKMKE